MLPRCCRRRGIVGRHLDVDSVHAHARQGLTLLGWLVGMRLGRSSPRSSIGIGLNWPWERHLPRQQR
eukprot:4910589-Pyramimonas_sp.AAC.1